MHQAVLATWDDGGALQAFVVSVGACPGRRRAAGGRSSGRSTTAVVAPDHRRRGVVRRRTTLYTTCDVRAADRPGLLHALAVAIASAGADVHAASVTTVNGIAHDRFDLSNQAGLRLDAALQNSIRVGVTSGTTGISLRRRGLATKKDRFASQNVVRT